MTAGNPDPRRIAFGHALDEAMRSADVKAPALATAVGLTADAVRKWVSGQSEPDPATAFAVEELLDVAPGELTRHLGYLPADRPPTVAAALDADPRLTPEARVILLATYRAARRGR